MCVLPFTTPSVEPDGGVRLCSAASIFDFPEETLMGNVRDGGLAQVWRNAKFQALRRSLLAGSDLRPYCNQCEYRFEGPPWLLVFHLALVAHNRMTTPPPGIADLVLRYQGHYPEYVRLAKTHGLWWEPFPEALRSRVLGRSDLLRRHPRVLEFAGNQSWRDLRVPVPRRLARRLAKGERIWLTIRWRNLVDGQVAAAAPNLRVSVEEEDLNRIAYAFLPTATAPGGDVWIPLADMLRSVDDLALGASVRVRVGGFGAAGTAIVLDELSFLEWSRPPDALPTAGLDALVEGATPVDIDLNTLNRCNVSCVMCPHAVAYDDRKEPKPPLYRLTLDEYRSIVDGVNVASAHFVGAYAEPLMNKELFAMLAYAREQGSKTAVTSNGTLLSRAFAEKLVDAGLGILTVSLHGASKAVAEKIMRGADFDRVIANIKTLQQVKKAKGSTTPIVQVNYVGQRDNVEELPAFIRLAASLGIASVSFVHLLVSAYVEERSSLVHWPAELARAVREARKVAKAVGVLLYVSSSYTAVIEQYEQHQAALAANG